MADVVWNDGTMVVICARYNWVLLMWRAVVRFLSRRSTSWLVLIIVF